MLAKQKHTAHDMMKKGLRKEYFYLKRDLLLACHVDFEHRSVLHYAAFDKSGVSLYQYDPQLEGCIRLVKRYPWSAWKRVKIDHYFTASQFIFQGDVNFILTAFCHGKDIQHVIEEYTQLAAEEVERPLWRKVPGYRSKAPVNMYAASLFYTALCALLCKMLLPHVVHVALFSISIGGTLLGLLFFTIGLIEPSIVLPFSKQKTRTAVLYIYSYLTLSSFISIFIFW